MRRFIDYLYRYPFELIISFLVAFALLDRPGQVSSALFILVCVVFSYALFLSRAKNKKIISVSLLTASIFIYYEISIHNLIVAAIAMSLGMSILMAYHYIKSREYLAASRRSAIRKMLTIGSIILIIMPYVYSLASEYSIEKDEVKIRQQAQQINHRLNQNIILVKDLAQPLFSDPFIAQLVKENKFEDLESYCQNIKIAKNLSYFAITDKNGDFLINIDHDELIGGKATDVFPDVTVRDEISGVFFNDTDALITYGKGLYADNASQPYGYIILAQEAGNDLKENILTDNEEFGIYYNSKLYSIDSSLASTNLAAKASSKGAWQDGQQDFLFSEGGKQYLAVGTDLDSCMAKLIIIKPITYKQEIYLNGTLLLGAILLLLYAIFSLRDKKPKNGSLNILFLKLKKDKHQTIIDKEMVILAIAELLLLVSTLVFVWHQGSIEYYKEIFEENIIERTDVNKVPDEGYFQIKSSKYAKVADEYRAEIELSNIPKGTNTVQFEMKYSSDLLSAKEIVVSDSACALVQEKEIDNNGGNIRIGCDMKNRTEQDSSPQSLATIVYQVKAGGWANLKMDKRYCNITSEQGIKSGIFQSSIDGEKIYLY